MQSSFTQLQDEQLPELRSHCTLHFQSSRPRNNHPLPRGLATNLQMHQRTRTTTAQHPSHYSCINNYKLEKANRIHLSHLRYRNHQHNIPKFRTSNPHQPWSGEFSASGILPTDTLLVAETIPRYYDAHPTQYLREANEGFYSSPRRRQRMNERGRVGFRVGPCLRLAECSLA